MNTLMRTNNIYLRLKLPLISVGIRIAQTVFKYRKHIYRTLVAQDRAIDKAFRVGGYGRQTRYGARHGALAGSIAGAFIGQDALPPDSAIPQKNVQKPSPSNKYQKRGRNFRNTSSRYQYGNRQPKCRCRKPFTRFR